MVLNVEELKQQLKQKAKTGQEIYDYLNQNGDYPCPKKCEWIKLDDVLALVGEWCEQQNERLKHYDSLLTVMNKCACVHCQTQFQLADIHEKQQAEASPKLQQIQNLLDEYTPKFIGKCKAGPPSDYQDLWFLTKQFRDKLGQILSEDSFPDKKESSGVQAHG